MRCDWLGIYLTESGNFQNHYTIQQSIITYGSLEWRKGRKEYKNMNIQEIIEKTNHSKEMITETLKLLERWDRINDEQTEKLRLLWQKPEIQT